MISSSSLVKLARCRFEEAKILLAQNKPDGAVYLCGYAIELMLKRKIVLLLDWDGYPLTNSEFENRKSFKIHDLQVLLNLSGLEEKIKNDTAMFAKWVVAGSWKSEIRYRDVGSLSGLEATDIINASREILNFILHNS